MKQIARLLALFVLALSLSAQVKDSKPDIGNRSLRGPAVWVLDSNGDMIRANIDSATLVLDPPGSAGGKPTLRAIIPAPQQGGVSPVRMRLLPVTYAGVPFVLPETPAANTSVLLFWGPMLQGPNDYIVSGQTVTLQGTGWLQGDKITLVYFY